MALIPRGRPRPVVRHRGTRVWLAGKLVARVLFAAFLVFGTYNPSGRSYVDWVLHSDAAATWKLIATGLLAVAYGVALPTVWRALGFGGIVLTTTLATTTSWALIQANWISLAAPDAPVWILLSVIAFVVGVGLCWMLVGRILDGQLRTRDLTR
ncbi:MAG TPA: DUF6524 family protein [Acetobacteraceae bacterium]|jgi:hypothetical protein|nr:DUF6524 family protein [Acetobacteraceae bacterium]